MATWNLREVPEEIAIRVKIASAKDRVSQKDWILDACLTKLEQPMEQHEQKG